MELTTVDAVHGTQIDLIQESIVSTGTASSVRGNVSFNHHAEYLKGIKQLFSLFQTNQETVEFLTSSILCRNSKTLLSGGFGSGKNTFVELTAKLFFGENVGIVRCHPELTVFDIMWNFDVQKFISSKVGGVIPRSLITSPFKYLNEIQRLNVQCQNALLSLLTDKNILFGDVEAETPDYVCFLDRNPHDIGTIGIVKALLDRIDFSLDVSFLGLKETRDVLQTKYQSKHINDLRQMATPVLDSVEMMEIWDDVERIGIPDDVFMRISLASIPLRKCVRVDRATCSPSFRLVCDGCVYLSQVCNKLERPLGHRWIDSVIKLSKARAWLSKRTEVAFDDVLWGLPFALSHRLELKPNLLIKHASELDWIKTVLSPDLQQKQAGWTEALALLTSATQGDKEAIAKLSNLKDRDLAILEILEWAQSKIIDRKN